MATTTLRPWLRLGPAEAASREHAAGAFVLNVLEAAPATPYDAWVPILRTNADNEEVEADVSALESVVRTIAMARTQGRVVYLHCGQGIERSPLAAAWTLWKLGETASFDEAYREVRHLHRPTQDRAVWIPWRARNP